jgi:cytochrome b561
MMLSICPMLGMSPPPAGQQGTAPPWTGIVPLLVIFLIVYIGVIRPRQKRPKEQPDLGVDYAKKAYCLLRMVIIVIVTIIVGWYIFNNLVP